MLRLRVHRSGVQRLVRIGGAISSQATLASDSYADPSTTILWGSVGRRGGYVATRKDPRISSGPRRTKHVVPPLMLMPRP